MANDIERQMDIIRDAIETASTENFLLAQTMNGMVEDLFARLNPSRKEKILLALMIVEGVMDEKGQEWLV